VAKKMNYIIVAAIVIVIGYMGWKLTSRNAYESAEYTVLEVDGNIELREYPDLMMATTSMSNVEGGDGSFGRLFRYISGGNQEKQKVAMTTPVFMEPTTNQGVGQMGFVIPKEVADSNAPEPTSDQVSLTKRVGGTFAVIRFSGRPDDDSRSRQITNLEAWIQQRGYQTEGEPEFAGYDPPWTPGPIRRNEILIRIGVKYGT